MRKALTALSALSALLWPLIIAFALYLDALFYVLPWLALIMLIRAGLSAGSKSSPPERTRAYRGPHGRDPVHPVLHL